MDWSYRDRGDSRTGYAGIEAINAVLSTFLEPFFLLRVNEIQQEHVFS